MASSQQQSPSQSTAPGPLGSSGIVQNSAKRQPKPPPRPLPPGASPSAPSPPPPSFKSAEIAPSSARRKPPNKRKAPEKQLPDRVAALLPESALYSQLLEFEARVDAALDRKKTDIQEALKNLPRFQRTLRIYVFNTYANQNRPTSTPAEQHLNSQAFSQEQPSWTLRIIGRILEEGAEVDAQAAAKPNPSMPKFSSFFRRITVQLDPALYPESHTIVWDGTRAASHVEGFEIKRKGDKEFTATIRFELNYSPEKYKLSNSLTDLLRIEVDTKPRIIAALWQYIKVKKLQEPTDPSTINCDPPLQRLFGEERIKFSTVSQKLGQHLFPPPPIHLGHQIKVSGNSPAGNACYDVAVDVPIPFNKEMSTFLANLEKHKDIDMYDENICNAIKKIHEHRRRRAFFLGFSQSPVDFINTLIASQSRDLKVVAGEASRNAERERRSDFYNQPWVEDAVIRYLNRRPTAGPEATGNT